MPQLAFETFVSQYFWLVFTLFTLYFILVTNLLPLISESYKARLNIDTKVKVLKNVVKDSLLIKEIASSHFFNTQYSSVDSYTSTFNKNFINWSNKIIK